MNTDVVEIINQRAKGDTKISTMVHYTLLKCNIDIMKLVSLLPIRYQKKSKMVSTKKKIDLPPIENPGEIIYAGYKNIKRGLIRSTKTNFKNELCIDIASNSKFIHCKVSPDTIHSCGSKSDEMTTNTVNYLFGYINYIQNILNRIQSNKQVSFATIEWLKNQTKSIECNVVSGTNIIVDNANIQYYQEEILPYMQGTGDISTIGLNSVSTNRKKVGRLLDFYLEQSLERIVKESSNLVNKFSSSYVGLADIMNCLSEYLINILHCLMHTQLIPIYKDGQYLAQQQTIENGTNYFMNVYYLIQSYRITIQPCENKKDMYVIYTFNGHTIHIYEEGIVEWFIKLLNLLKKYNGSPIYKDVELTNDIKYPEFDSSSKVDNDGYIIVDDQKYDYYVIDYLLKLIRDYKHHDTYVRQLEWIKTLNVIYTGTLEIERLKYISLNFNYNLGDQIILANMATEFSKVDGFNVQWDKLTQKYVTIQMPYKISDELKSYIHKNKKTNKEYHSFLIYPKGSVTQSGPHYGMDVQAYYKFMYTYLMARDNIVKLQGSICDCAE